MDPKEADSDDIVIDANQQQQSEGQHQQRHQLKQGLEQQAEPQLSADTLGVGDNNNKDADQEELEEGEIAEEDDSNDDEDDFEAATAEEAVTVNGGEPNTGAGVGKEPRKKRKRLVRVRRKVRVKKKVAKQRAAEAEAGAAATAAASSTSAPEASAISANNELIKNSNDDGSSFGQQSIMLQELRHAQILRAAATDEDLRISAGPMQQPFQHPALIHQQNQQPLLPLLNQSLITQQQHQQQQHYHQIPLASTTMTSIMSLNPIMTPTLLGNTATTTNTTYVLPTNHQTPSSPDDENEKSSYDAISKMLTMLRHSVNDSDENNDPNDNQNHHHQNSGADKLEESGDDAQEEPVQEKNSIDYALVPILIQEIDYTKYRLLSRYEPKFKYDPRLNQQQI